MTLDHDVELRPDLLCELGLMPIPLADNSVDLAVAEHVLEHIGHPGETREWFYFWEEMYRVLKPEGTLRFVSPMWNSVWAWSDPSHVRVISPEALAFFNQDNYRIKGSSISPYRIRCDFQPVSYHDDGDGNFSGTLKARKPLKPWWED